MNNFGCHDCKMITVRKSYMEKSWKMKKGSNAGHSDFFFFHYSVINCLVSSFDLEFILINIFLGLHLFISIELFLEFFVKSDLGL